MLKIIQHDKIIKLKAKLKLNLKWILLLSFFGVLAGTANWANEIHKLATREGVTPAYSIEKLALNDENTVLYWTGGGVYAYNLTRSQALPYFDGIRYVDNITDGSARVWFDMSTLYNKYIYIAYALSSLGVWEQKSWYPNDTAVSYYTWRYMDISGLTPGEWQTVRIVIATDTQYSMGGLSDYNQMVARFKTNPFPAPPSSVTVKAKANDGKFYIVRAGSWRRVTLTTTRVHDQIVSAKFYTDSLCTDLVGETTTLNGPNFELAVEDDLVGDFHHFYATQTSTAGATSPCSLVSANYQVADCPEDYVLVQPDAATGTPAFCLMATEARQGANDVAVPGFAAYPWETTPQEAKNACRRVGPNCDLVTNLEWMAAARQIEQYDYAFSHSGHVLANLGVLNISNTNNEYDQLGTNNTRYRRTFKLPDGTLWDFAGNLAEWADNAEVGGEIFQPITNTCDHGPFGIKDANFDCPDLDVRYYTPYSKSSHSSYYVGRIVGPEPYDQYGGVSLAAARGGHHSDLYNSGIYSLFMFNHMDDTNGFRCVCHLPEE